MVRIIIGEVRRIFSSCGDEIGLEAVGVMKIDRIRRSLYLAVSIVARINRAEITRFIGFRRISSRIRSLE